MAINHPSQTPGILTEDDPRIPFAAAVDLGGAVIAGVRRDQFGHGTPCEEFDVRDLCGHLVGVLRRVAAVGRGDDPFSVPFVVEGDGFATAWAAAARDVQEVWSAPGILDRTMTLPFATLPGSVTLGIYCSEVTIHTWDLAAATGQRPRWDDAVVSTALTALQRALPADLRYPKAPFAEMVAVAEDAPLIDRLVAWSGRRP